MTKKMNKTVGQQAKALVEKPNLDTKQSLMDTSKEMQKNYIPEIEKCIKNHKMWTDPFYVVVINKRERLMMNAIRQYFLARQTLPTPDYDQTVFKYSPSSGSLEFLWTLPDKHTIDFLLATQDEMPKEEQQLQQFCLLFKMGTLDKVYGK